MKKTVIIIIVAFLFSSCHFWDVQKDKYSEKILISFETSNLVVLVGDIAVLTVEITPVSAVNKNNVSFFTSNKNVAKVRKVTETSCIVEAVSVGSTIISATIANSMAQGVVIVK